MPTRWRQQAEQHWLFFRQWMRAPLTTASVVPSSQFLAKKMVAQVPSDAKVVVELGPGTGVFTEQLRQLPGLRKLLVVELNAEMVAKLRKDFSGDDKVLVIEGNAALLPELLRLQQINEAEVDAVISGLGLLSMPPALVRSILLGVFKMLRADAPLIQFTYGPVAPIPRELQRSLALRSERVGFTLRNLPPASVYAIKQRRA